MKPTRALSASDLDRVTTIVRKLSPKHCEAWLTAGRRIADGMPAAEAEALMWRELAEAGEA